MKRFKNQILLAAGFAILAGVISGITAAPAIAAVIKAALIKNVDEKGRVPFQRTITETSATPISVPADRRLVIEHISGTYAWAGPGEILLVALLSASGDRIVFNPDLYSSSPTFKQYFVNSPARLYLEPSTTLGYTISAGGSGVPSYTLTITGYWVDLTI